MFIQDDDITGPRVYCGPFPDKEDVRKILRKFKYSMTAKDICIWHNGGVPLWDRFSCCEKSLSVFMRTVDGISLIEPTDLWQLVERTPSRETFIECEFLGHILDMGIVGVVFRPPVWLGSGDDRFCTIGGSISILKNEVSYEVVSEPFHSVYRARRSCIAKMLQKAHAHLPIELRAKNPHRFVVTQDQFVAAVSFVIDCFVAICDTWNRMLYAGSSAAFKRSGTRIFVQSRVEQWHALHAAWEHLRLLDVDNMIYINTLSMNRTPGMIAIRQPITAARWAESKLQSPRALGLRLQDARLLDHAGQAVPVLQYAWTMQAKMYVGEKFVDVEDEDEPDVKPESGSEDIEDIEEIAAIKLAKLALRGMRGD